MKALFKGLARLAFLFLIGTVGVQTVHAGPAPVTIEVPIIGVNSDPSLSVASVHKTVGINVTRRQDATPLTITLWHASGNQHRIPPEYHALLTQVLSDGLGALGYDTHGLSITITFAAPFKQNGPSLSAALVVAAATALDGKTLRPGVVLTGTVEPDGRIGPIGFLDDKISGTKSSQYHTILYPASQEPARMIEGVKAIPVATLADALRYMQASPYDPF